jgi:hypothetical protein
VAQRRDRHVPVTAVKILSLAVGLYVFWRSVRSLAGLVEQHNQDELNQRIAESATYGGRYDR